MGFQNCYSERRRADAYDELELGGTYRLAFDVLPRLLERYVAGRRALDFGCGTGRSARFLKSLGYDVVGLDVSAEMVSRARERDPGGAYHVAADGDLGPLAGERFALILAAFPFDNIPGRDRKVRLLGGLARLLREDGVLVNIVSTPEIYTHEWVTFTTREFPENRGARAGDVVRIVTKDYSDGRPVEDILWPDQDYRDVYRDSGLEVIRAEAPLATGEEGVAWLSETSVAPWRIYVLRAVAPV